MTSINEARKALREGSVIIYPTDTVWGIGCDPFNQTSVNKLFKIKGKKNIFSKKVILGLCQVNIVSLVDFWEIDKIQNSLCD